MAHFAKIENNKVIDINVINNEDCGGGNFPESEKIGQEFIASLGIEGEWLQTSYNTYMGNHLNGGIPFRKNYAMIGGTYDSEKDAFIPIKPEEDGWTLNEETFVWERTV
jgi:hypothetical protein